MTTCHSQTSWMIVYSCLRDKQATHETTSQLTGPGSQWPIYSCKYASDFIGSIFPEAEINKFVSSIVIQLQCKATLHPIMANTLEIRAEKYKIDKYDESAKENNWQNKSRYPINY